MSTTISTVRRISRDFFHLSDFGERLKQAYESHTVADLARKMGVTHQAAKNYVEGRLPAAERLLEISNSTGCSIDWLLTGLGTKYRSNVPVFDLERSVDEHDDWHGVITDWFDFDGREMPDTLGASFMGGWNRLSRQQKIDAIRDLKMLLDKIADESDIREN